MSDKDLNSLLRKYANAASTYRSIKGALDYQLEERYGVVYNDLPGDVGDAIVDHLDYSDGQPVSLKFIDDVMTAAGYPPHKADSSIGGTE